MKNIIRLMLVTFCLAVFSQANADNKFDIEAINKKVDKIEKMKGSLKALEIKLHAGESESSPPEVMYYYKPDNLELVILRVSVGHEIFVTKHTYYFENNHAIKYLKETLNHPDSPPKQAILYKNDGSVLWKNVAEPVVSGKKVVELFMLNIATLKEFAKY